MTKSEIQAEALAALIQNKRLVVEFSTGVGKSKVAIEFLKLKRPERVLLVVAETLHKQNWEKEFRKWGALKIFKQITVECYASLHKYRDTEWDCIVFDECFTGDTEVLTDSGFKRFDSLDKTEKIAQFTESGNIEFVSPLNYIKRHHSGKMVDVSLYRNRHCFMTPGHNQVFKTKAIDRWRTKPISNLNFSHLTEIPASGLGTGDNTLLSYDERMIIAIQADGTLQRHQKNESTYSIMVKKDRKRKRLNKFYQNLPNMTKIKSKEGYDRYIYKAKPGNAKLLSSYFLINMGYDRANDFINEILEWDGSHSMGATKYYSSKIKENVDFVSAVAVQAGYRVLISKEEDNRKDNYSTIYRLYLRRDQKISTQRFSKKYYDYDGDVYCVEVPSHMIVVRSQGLVFVSGNCHHMGSDLKLDILSSVKSEYVLCLSATFPKRSLLPELEKIYGKFSIKSLGLQKAIDNDILPEPTIYTIPLILPKKGETEEFVEEWGKAELQVTIVANYQTRWTYKKNKATYPNVKLIVKCTPYQKYLYLCDQFNFWKQQVARGRGEFARNKQMRYGTERKEFLGLMKTSLVPAILEKLEDKRYMCFCTNIEQCDALGGEYSIHSKKKGNEDIVEKFNNLETNKIFVVFKGIEGMNFNQIESGLFVVLEGSERRMFQKFGRLLRAEHPEIYILYYKDTRDEEFLKNAIEGIDKNYIKELNYDEFTSKH